LFIGSREPYTAIAEPLPVRKIIANSEAIRGKRTTTASRTKDTTSNLQNKSLKRDDLLRGNDVNFMHLLLDPESWIIRVAREPV
jgi:hypothetical protein